MFLVPLNSALPKFELLHCRSETNGLYLGPKPVGVWWDKHWKSKCSPWIKRAVRRNQIRRRSIWLSSTACLWFLSGVWAHLSGNVNTKCSCPAKLLDSSGPLKKIKLHVPLRNRVHLVWGEWHSQISRPGDFKLSCWKTWADTSERKGTWYANKLFVILFFVVVVEPWAANSQAYGEHVLNFKDHGPCLLIDLQPTGWSLN